MKNLHQLDRRLTKTIKPICPITNRAGARCYDAPAWAEAIADYLEEQFKPQPTCHLSNDAGTLRACGRGERALLKRLDPFLSPRKEQYGFRTGHSITLQLLRVLILPSVRDKLRMVHGGRVPGYGEDLQQSMARRPTP
ncbi:hypothetical protein EVAR_52436_1 [Eumeta japonica]|uniref:Uncharacterized protein n=1 Tax=Eumeta variegata TaxID=151549 RepID=A0A4C1YJZ6_EUMVA|nr:hypothetical protein EVAR_52436_1 [Eumeta japonica]